ncbi:hypothetical protein BDF20DRAFT_886710 [Mycotypha africana]|uniref:uncharacterized protein n=1 Tax=Mycotypha africana TaxID=64632 RepID=UPI002301D8F6|nr:uncharacterized protein BDF20DRAFT_886710 [Mycotypha africana]KAI8971826.1 hypothetical protein BDF20DRAFT_886710 [Mycotypha africana]
MSTLKPIIKLPPRNTTHNNNNNNNNNSNNNRLNPSNNNRTLTAESTTYSTSPKQQQLSISNELFFEDMDNKLTDYDIQNVLQGFKIFQIRREVGGGYISFLSARVAERVYTLLNGYMFTSQTVLKFRFSSNNDPQPEGDIWEISNLPLHIDHNSLYDIFRPYGPLSICKFLIEDTTATTTGHEGKALVQYFFRDDSDRASIEMVCKF